MNATELKDILKHTPGPWRLDFPYPGTDGESLVSPSYHFVDAGKGYYPKGFGLGVVSSEADARLIAAAPELLEALVWIRDGLQTALDDAEDPSLDDLLLWLAHSESAIAKAKGEQEE